MINAVKKAYLLCFSPSGRTTRSEYWLFQLYQLLVIIALIVIAMITIPFNDSTDNIFVAILILFAEIWFLVNIIPNITILMSCAQRRTRDFLFQRSSVFITSFTAHFSMALPISC